MNPVVVKEGASPVILAMPHTGTDVPEDVMARLNGEGRKLRDTDWHIDRLYDGLLPEATVVRANFHRYLIDANRDPTGRSLYPGQNTTGLVPATNFDDRPIWVEPPTPADIEARLATWHRPYHAEIERQIERVKAIHGRVLLYDCHSIRSRCPFLFDGELPVLNIGTNDGVTCDPALEAIAREHAQASGYSFVVNGRFKGGWTTRRYGRPDRNCHAIQMEIAQSAYLAAEEAPWRFDEEKAAPLRGVLKGLLENLETAVAGTGARR